MSGDSWLAVAAMFGWAIEGWLSWRRHRADWICIGRLHEKNARLRAELGLPAEDDASRGGG